MRSTFLLSAAVLGLTAGTALAQSDMSGQPGMPAGAAGMPTTPSQSIRPGHVPGEGTSFPLSTQASNINGADTRSTIAPTLPTPPTGGGPEHYIHAAQRALVRHQSGEAQQAIEMAETRLLDRSVIAGQTNVPTDNPMVASLEQARQALGRHDWAGANRHLNDALSQTASAGGMPMAEPTPMPAGTTGSPTMSGTGTDVPPSPGSTAPGQGYGMQPTQQ